MGQAHIFQLQRRASSTSQAARAGGVCSRSALVISGLHPLSPLCSLLPSRRLPLDPQMCCASPRTRGIGGISAGSQPTMYRYVGFSARWPHQNWEIGSVHPPQASAPPGFGRQEAGQGVEVFGCSRTPPCFRTCSTANSARSFSSGLGFANFRSCPQARQGGCATTDAPPGQRLASLSASQTSVPGMAL